jgi:4'-phosphopantetheinyl transferase
MMQPVPVRWWKAGQGLPPALPKLVVIGVDGQGERGAARRTIRAAALAALAAMTGLAPARILLNEAPGRAPYALLDGDESKAALSISHDGALSLAAIRLDGAVGIDVMRMVDFPDWQAVADDYLGPSTAAALSALAPERRAATFARAWSEREARLKCLGMQLAEWDMVSEQRLAVCACLPLDLPDGYVGTLALAPGRPGHGA